MTGARARVSLQGMFLGISERSLAVKQSSVAVDVKRKANEKSPLLFDMKAKMPKISVNQLLEPLQHR